MTDRGRVPAEEVLASIDRERLAEICMGLVDISSPTGDEARCSEWIAEQLRAVGASGDVQPIDARQANAWGRVTGSGEGPTLMLYSPIDTLTTGNAEEDVPWVADSLAPHMKPIARREGDIITGLGAMNPKGHAACVITAFETIARSGVELRGDLIAAFGAGGMPTNARSRPGEPLDRRNTGQGVGCSFLVEQGVWADAAVIAKTGWSISWEEVGLAWCDITVRGTHTYVGARHRIPYRNPIADAATVISHLEDWFPTYSERHTTGLVSPQGVVSAVDAGWWRMAAVVPSQARIRVDLRIGPDQTPLDACRELRIAIDELVATDPGLDVSVELSVGIAGSRTDPDHWICRRAIGAWELVAGGPHVAAFETSGATDANILRSRGIPTVRVGLPKVFNSGVELDFAAGMNTVDLGGMELLTRHLVCLALDVCGQSRADVVGSGPEPDSEVAP